MKVFIILAAVVVAAYAATKVSDDEVNTQWEAFKTKYSKSYDSDTEESLRKLIFKEKLTKITKHNEKYAKGEVTFKRGINKFSDKLSHEVAKLKGYKMRSGRTKNYATMLGNSTLPDTVNWVEKGYVTAVKDQGECGGCWAFSSTGALEGQFYKESGTLTSLSEQNLIDCSDSYGNEGCDGGLMDDAFSYVEGNGGIDTESSYPFTGEDGTCEYDSSNSPGTDSGYVDISESESALKEAVAEIGPISVAIDASLDSFDDYVSGIYYEADCSSTDLDHGVLAVGYGTEDGEAYWLVKNSWGTDWGLEGYIMMARNRDNNCGIASEASYPYVTSSDVDTSSSSDSTTSSSSGGNSGGNSQENNSGSQENNSGSQENNSGSQGW